MCKHLTQEAKETLASGREHHRTQEEGDEGQKLWRVPVPLHEYRQSTAHNYRRFDLREQPTKQLPHGPVPSWTAKNNSSFHATKTVLVTESSVYKYSVSYLALLYIWHRSQLLFKSVLVSLSPMMTLHILSSLCTYKLLSKIPKKPWGASTLRKGAL